MSPIESPSKDDRIKDTAPLPTLLQGVYVRHQGKVLAAIGLAAPSAVQRDVAAALESVTTQDGIFTLDTNPPCIGVTLRTAETEVVLIRNANDNGTLFDFISAVPFAADILNHFITSPYDALTVADKYGSVRFISPLHEKAMGLKHGQAIGLPLSQVIPSSRLGHIIASGKAEIAQMHTLGGAVRIVNRIPIKRDGEVVGAIGRVLFKGPEAIRGLYTEISRLKSEVQRYRQKLDDMLEAASPVQRLVGDSAPMQELKGKIAMLAGLDIPVLILGESGTGKELVAKALHELSPRHDKNLISLNLAALPSSLLEAELFGYAPGAFTGSAKEGRPGKFELADKSTLFLDEVGDIPLEVQVKLLRVLEDHMVERLGEHRPQRVDFRLVSATHRDMEELLRNEHFRLDLYYRLGGVTVRVPPLRERLEDIPVLLSHFVSKFCARNQLTLPAIDDDVLAFLTRQSWPGNVRQFRHQVEEALVFSVGKKLTPTHFQTQSSLSLLPPRPSVEIEALSSTRIEPMQTVMARTVQHAIQASGGNKRKAAEALRISRSHLYKLLNDL